MNRKNRKFGYGIAALTLAGFALGAVWASNTQCLSFIPKVVAGSGCPSSYVGYVKMTNSVGSFWITPPTNTVTGTFINTSVFSCDTDVTRKSDLMPWCGTNSVTFPATNSTSYEFIAYVTTTPAPTNGQMITVQVNWQ
jgi:hypothetical protein